MPASQTIRQLYQTGCSIAACLLLLLFTVTGIRAVSLTFRNILDHSRQVQEQKQYDHDCGQTTPTNPRTDPLQSGPCRYEPMSVEFVRISSKGGGMIAARISGFGDPATPHYIRNWDGRIDTVPASGQYPVQIWHDKPMVIVGPSKALLTDVNPRELNSQAQNWVALAISLLFLTFSSLMLSLTVFGRGGILAALRRPIS